MQYCFCSSADSPAPKHMPVCSHRAGCLTQAQRAFPATPTAGSSVPKWENDIQRKKGGERVMKRRNQVHIWQKKAWWWEKGRRMVGKNYGPISSLECLYIQCREGSGFRMQLLSLRSQFQDDMTQTPYRAGIYVWSDKSHHQCLQGIQST